MLDTSARGLHIRHMQCSYGARCVLEPYISDPNSTKPNFVTHLVEHVALRPQSEEQFQDTR